MGKRQVAELPGEHCADEMLDPGLAEEIDGLAWIADQEDGLGMAVPGCGEKLEEVVLAGGGVLHLVDQQVLEARAELGGEVLGAGFLGEGVASEQAEFGEVALAALGENELKLDQGAAEDAEEGLGNRPLLGGILRGGKFLYPEHRFAQVVAIAELIDQCTEPCLPAGVQGNAEVASGESLAPTAGGRRKHHADEGEPMVKVGGGGLRRFAAAGTGGDAGRLARLLGVVGEFGGQDGEFGEHQGREGLFKPRELLAEGQCERTLQAGQDVRVEEGVVKAAALGNGDELTPDQIAPLIAQGEHVRDQRFAVGEIAVAVEQEVTQGVVEDGIAAAQQQQCAPGSFAVERLRILGRGQAATASGEDGEGARNLRADGVDGADVEAVRLLQQRPPKLPAALQHGEGESEGLAVEIAGGVGRRVVVAGCFKTGEHAVAHLGGGLFSEGDGENLFRLADGRVGEEFEEAMNEQRSLAGAGGRFDDEGAMDVEGFSAGFGIGRLGRSGQWRGGLRIEGGIEREGWERQNLSHGLPPSLRRARRRRRNLNLRGRRGRA